MRLRLKESAWTTSTEEIGPPDLSSLNPRLLLPGVHFEGFQLGAMQCGTQLRGPAGIHFIQAFGDRVALLPVQELRNRRSVQLVSRNLEAAGSSFRQTEKVVGYRDGGLHVHRITRVIPGPLHRAVPARPSPKGPRKNNFTLFYLASWRRHSCPM